jgi:hypothetical protein
LERVFTLNLQHTFKSELIKDVENVFVDSCYCALRIIYFLALILVSLILYFLVFSREFFCSIEMPCECIAVWITRLRIRTEIYLIVY